MTNVFKSTGIYMCSLFLKLSTCVSVRMFTLELSLQMAPISSVFILVLCHQVILFLVEMMQSHYQQLVSGGATCQVHAAI